MSIDAPHGGENLEVMREAENYNEYLRSLIRRFGGDAATALDFGAGLGTFSDALGLAPEMMHCVEPEDGARAVLAAQGYHAYAELSEVPDSTVPYVYSLNVLEHIDNDAATLRELHRVLTPGGQLFVYVPAFRLLFTSMDRHVGHCRRYRLRQLVTRIRDAGFTVRKSAYTDALGFFATLAFRVVDGPDPAPLNPRLVRYYDRYLFPLSRVLSGLLAKVLGKNVYAVARKPAETRV